MKLEVKMGLITLDWKRLALYGRMKCILPYIVRNVLCTWFIYTLEYVMIALS